MGCRPLFVPHSRGLGRRRPRGFGFRGFERRGARGLLRALAEGGRKGDSLASMFQPPLGCVPSITKTTMLISVASLHLQFCQTHGVPLAKTPIPSAHLDDLFSLAECSQVFEEGAKVRDINRYCSTVIKAGHRDSKPPKP